MLRFSMHPNCRAATSVQGTWTVTLPEPATPRRLARAALKGSLPRLMGVSRDRSGVLGPLTGYWGLVDLPEVPRPLQGHMGPNPS